jgi:hypothetical protein
MKKINSFVAITAPLLMLLISGGFSPVWAQDPWTAIGCTGATDGVDIGELVCANLSNAAVSPNAITPAQVTIRYNIVAVSDLVRNPNEGFAFTARFRDNGPQARVMLRLRSVEIATGTVGLIRTLDSNEFAPSAGFQTRTSMPIICSRDHFDFERFAYFVEAVLVKNTPGALAELAAIRIGLGPDHGVCPP